MSNILNGQNTHGLIVSVERLKKAVIGSATQAAKEPFIAKTIKLELFEYLK